jgi:hypothetical protein
MNVHIIWLKQMWPISVGQPNKILTLSLCFAYVYPYTFYRHSHLQSADPNCLTSVKLELNKMVLEISLYLNFQISCNHLY